MRVLVVDDEHYIRDLLSRSLRKWGYEVTTAEDGDGAWRILKRADAPPILIVDWDMPGLKGVEIVRLLRTAEHGHSVYVVMLTGRMKKTDLVEALEAGVDDYLTKPFNARELQLRLARAVAARDQRTAPPAALPPGPLSGVVLAGKYRLERQVGEGGMADVWRATHIALEIPVAIKFMKPIFAANADYASFEREARAAAKLRSPHSLHVYDHGVTGAGMPYLVMEYLSGEMLADRVIRCGPLPPVAVTSIVDQIGRALAEAHQQDIVHGDVKPENIVLVDHADWPHGLAKLVDFGLAKHVKPDAAAPGTISGTPSYMSPEHITGTAPPNVALDLWALSATAFTALTGRCAFEADTLAALIHRVCNVPHPPPSALDPTLDGAVDAWFALAFAKDAALRFRSAQELTSSFAIACANADKGLSERALRALQSPPALAKTEPLVAGTVRRS
ncbi:MAG: response regulator [Labilithrix sp.]|nr:response regulator [Labilithrix sp.]MCW5812507.1 response regulator [Labilithrix sp.]